MLEDGQMTKERNAMARGTTQMLHAVKLSEANMADEELRMVGPRAAAVSMSFRMTGTMADGKPWSQRGVWSGVLGVQGDRTVILQQHLSRVH
jgi:hypothetical protein